MIFGVRKAEAPISQGRSPINWFGKEDTRIRFLEELDDWTKIFQHFSNSSRSSYPCTGDMDTCPGCNSDDDRESKASCRFITMALDVSSGYANLYSVPVSLITPLERYSDKDGGTVMARDYTVVQYKEDGFTKYQVEKEERERINFDKFILKDHQQALNEQYQLVWGSNDSPQAQERAPKEEPSPVRRFVPPKEETTVPYIDRIKPEDKEEVPEPTKRRGRPPGTTKPRTMEEAIAAKKDDIPPSEPQQEKDAAEGDEETLVMTEEEIRLMDLEDLEKLFDQCGVVWDSDDVHPHDTLIHSLGQ